MAKRPYSEAFLKLGFTELDGKPKCVVCLKVLSAESMKKNKLKRHLETNHPNCLDKPVEFFERKLNSIQGQRNIMTKFATENKLAVYSSYVASYQIAKQKKGHTIGEDLLMPVMKEVVKIMIGEKESKKLNAISLSNSTVKRRITDMSDDVLEQILTHVKASPFYSIQLDESTDIAGLPQLSVFIRYINNGAVSEDLLFCKALKLHTKGEDIFQCLNDFFTEHSIPWEKCAGICTDGAAACTGFKSGVVKRIKDKAPDAEWTHCFLHREALCAKKMSQELHEVLNSVVKCVNLIKARPLNQRIFSCLCSDMDADHKALLLHSEVRWLSRGRVLKRVCDLRDEIVIFLTQQHFTELAEKFSREDFNAKIAYLADIFDSLNCLNLSMQGVGFTVIDHAAKVAAYYKKLILWKSYAARNQYDMFAELTKYICGKEIDIKQTIIGHLNQLAEKFVDYYGDDLSPTNENDWIIDPFAGTDLPQLPLLVAEEFMDMTAEPTNRISFASFREKHPKDSVSIHFWASIYKTYPTVSRFVIKKLIPFATTWLCEAGFSAMCILKTKHRNRLEVEADLRLCLSTVSPRFQKLTDGKQAQISH